LVEKAENGGAVFRFPTTPTTAAGISSTPHGQGGGILLLWDGQALADVSGFGIQADQEFVRQSDADHLGRLAGSAQPLLEGLEVRLIAAHHTGHDEQDFAD
jgi:hypothetical protein